VAETWIIIQKMIETLNLNKIFPVVRRVYPALIANELVTVQPMSVSNGLLHFLDYQYGEDGEFNIRNYLNPYPPEEETKAWDTFTHNVVV